MSDRTRHTGIDNKSRNTVHDRDRHRCVYCRRTDRGIELAHFISRAQGGLGIPQNLISLCVECHRSYDGTERGEMREFLTNYLKLVYPEWDENKLIYQKE